jgi:hypothetical protein
MGPPFVKRQTTPLSGLLLFSALQGLAQSAVSCVF